MSIAFGNYPAKLRLKRSRLEVNRLTSKPNEDQDATQWVPDAD